MRTTSLSLGTSLLASTFFAVACNDPPPPPLPPAGMAGAPLAQQPPASAQPAALPTALPGAGAAQMNPQGSGDLPPGHPPIDGMAPPSGVAAAANAVPEAPAAELTGVVQETLEVPEYTYMRVKTADQKEEWVAVTKTPVAVGDTVRVAQSIVMPNFTSKTLNRTFPRLVMGTLSAAPAHKKN